MSKEIRRCTACENEAWYCRKCFNYACDKAEAQAKLDAYDDYRKVIKKELKRVKSNFIGHNQSQIILQELIYFVDNKIRELKSKLKGGEDG